MLTPDELARLLAAVDEPYRTIFELAAETGARLGETLGLVWGEIDFDQATVTFTHQLDRNGRRVALKTRRSRRCIEITPALVSKLRAAPARGRSLRRARLRVHDPQRHAARSPQHRRPGARPRRQARGARGRRSATA